MPAGHGKQSDDADAPVEGWYDPGRHATGVTVLFPHQYPTGHAPPIPVPIPVSSIAPL